MKNATPDKGVAEILSAAAAGRGQAAATASAIAVVR